MTLLDECTRQCLTVRAECQITSDQVVEVLEKAIRQYGAPGYISSNNDSESIADKIETRLKDHQVKTIYMDPGSPWQNGYIESLHSHFRDERLNREWLLNLREARVIIDDCRQHYNTERPHSRLGHLIPEEFIQTLKHTT